MVLTRGQRNYIVRLEIELERLKMSKHCGSSPRKFQQQNVLRNETSRSETIKSIEAKIKSVKSSI